MDPKRIRVRDLVEPFRVGAASVNLNRQSKSRNQDRFVWRQIIPVHMTLDVRGNRIFAPAPVGERARIEFQPSTWRGKASLDFTIIPVNFNTSKTTAVLIAIRAWQGNNIWRRGLGRSREHATEMIFAYVFQLFSGHGLFVDSSDFPAHLKGAVAAHKFQRRQVFGGSFLRQTRQ